MAEDWSREEVEAAVADYFAMLGLELTGQPFNKAEHNRQLQRLLNKRPKGSRVQLRESTKTSARS